MRQLLPEPLDEVDPVARYLDGDRPAPADRPWTAIGMIASADGATAIDGTSGPLGGMGDRIVFRAVRAIADVVVVAAGTVRAENYRAVALPDDVLAARRERGRNGQPALAVVTRSGDLDPTSRLFADGHRPIVIMPTDAAPATVDRLRTIADVHRFGDGQVDLAAAWRWLGRSFGVAVVEGGPSLNGAVAAAGLVDELCLTIAPTVVAGDSPRIVAGGGARLDHHDLVSLLTDDEGYLFARYSRRRT